MNRRTFLTWVGVGWVASSLPVAIAACAAKVETPTKTAADDVRKNGFQAVGTTAELDSSGQILNQEFTAGPLLVVRNPANPNTLSAVNPTCTHRGCIVGWQVKEKVFVCPCHGSKFATDGKVLSEPADKPLSTYEVKTEGDSVLVKAS